MKIFRKIRWSSITKNSFSKYFFYAVGEILLVVLGILIALYINNKKDTSDRKEKQRNHLILVQEELENNFLILEKEEKTLANIIVNIRDLINLANSEKSKDTIKEINLSKLLFLPITRAIEVDYENAAFHEFIASNGLKDIKNDSLRSFLRSLDRKLQTFKLQENVVHESLDKSNYFIEINGSLKTIFDNLNFSENYFEVKNSPNTISNKSILDSKQFENILIQYLGVATQLYKTEYPTFKESISVLIRIIKEDVNN
ncbi:hypothetical protein [uncultured Polaribacter sp.]|uniref:hypothetical protein n=1 Tax=uncultured Polaribacter sp. TaxID=174711 RepID=UPI002631FE93|nr:hypothetical protein [uncultured Polaribacter sp.]